MPVKSRKMRGGANAGIYTFTNDTEVTNGNEVYFFSDLEGNMPDGIKNLMFNENDKPLSLGNKVIVFTGDLIDRGEYSIRNLKRMIALKKANPKNVILICGNRDTNKIRMYPECHIQEIEEQILNGKDKDKDKDFDAILGILQGIPDDASIFTNKLNAIREIIDIKGINGPTDVRPVFTEIYSDDISRITKMYSNTLGSPKQIEFFALEFGVLFEKDFGINNEFWKLKDGEKMENDKYKILLKFIAMMNMVMGKVWDDNVLPAILVPYNGLYIKYLQQCHIMASITVGTKLCIVSHAGIPYDETLATFYIPTEIGDISIGSVNYIGNIEGLNTSFTAFIERIKGGNIAYKEYKKYVAMSANCDDTVAPYTAYASPIVSQKDLEGVKNNKGLDLDKFRYGSITHIYNIFGHQPSGLLPYISRNSKGTSYHIDLDISRAENPIISNQKSYVYLRITKDTDMLFGKTVLNNTYHSIKEEKLQEAPVEVKELDGLPRNIYNDKEGEKNTLNINYEGDTSYPSFPLDSYCDNVLQAKYTTEVQNTKNRAAFTSTLFTIDNTKYYGMFSWTLVEYDKTGLNGGSRRGKTKTKVYTKSIKRFLYGKRKMVVYVGKRGGEYVKVKGEYVSLAKFRR
jgi:hypothetical protein